MGGKPVGGRPRALVVCADAAVCDALADRCGGGIDVAVVSRAQLALERARCGPGLDLVFADLETVSAQPRLLGELARCGDPIRVLMADDPTHGVQQEWSAVARPRWDVQLVTSRPPALECVQVLIRAARLRGN